MSAGEDGICNNLLKAVSEFITTPLTYIFTLSFLKGTYPDSLKNALIIPLFKKGDRNAVENYRPISLLPCIGKILEIIVNDRLTGFLEKYNLLHNCQHGFRKSFSTDTALSQFIHNIQLSLDRNLTTMGLYVDFTKAFDCVNHQILIEKLHRYGIRGVALDWFTSYLSNRSQKVQLHNATFSSLRSVDCGVPQGSILGPTLFIIYANDLHLYLQKLPNVLQIYYADDSNFLITGNSLQEVASIATGLLQSITLWCNKNRLVINNDKTTHMLFRKRYSSFENSLNISLSISSKLLGVVVDNTLSWTSHIDYICGKLTKVC